MRTRRCARRCVTRFSPLLLTPASFYLMSPEGRFVDAFGKIFTKDQVIEKVDAFIAEHKDGKTWGDPIS